VVPSRIGSQSLPFGNRISRTTVVRPCHLTGTVEDANSRAKRTDNSDAVLFHEMCDSVHCSHVMSMAESYCVDYKAAQSLRTDLDRNLHTLAKVAILSLALAPRKPFAISDNVAGTRPEADSGGPSDACGAPEKPDKWM